MGACLLVTANWGMHNRRKAILDYLQGAVRAADIRRCDRSGVGGVLSMIPVKSGTLIDVDVSGHAGDARGVLIVVLLATMINHHRYRPADGASLQIASSRLCGCYEPSCAMCPTRWCWRSVFFAPSPTALAGYTPSGSTATAGRSFLCKSRSPGTALAFVSIAALIYSHPPCTRSR